MDKLRFVDACTEEHFRAMSLIHALGWRDTYVDAVPADYMASEITDDRWVDVFRANYETRNGVHGLLLYRGVLPQLLQSPDGELQPWRHLHLRQHRLCRLGRNRLLLHSPCATVTRLRWNADRGGTPETESRWFPKHFCLCPTRK